MSLKHDIVIVNEFTYAYSKGGRRGGTRGATPGMYVSRYMARNGAVEDLTPVRLFDADDIDVRYRAREGVADVADSLDEVAHGIAEADGRGGIAFGTGCLSLSHASLAERSSEIQSAFDDGKCVMKVVLSFDTNYLDRMHAIENVDEVRDPGDFRGRVDQMKLRLAISRGMGALSRRGFDNLRWVGVIQVDTMHVHCHVAAVDVGEGRLRADGSQRGMLSDGDKVALRSAIDRELTRSARVRVLTSNVQGDRNHTREVVRKYISREVSRRSLPQLIYASLPDNKRLWRAGSHAKSMARANELTRAYVMSILARPGMGFGVYVEGLREDARHRESAGLSHERAQAYVEHNVDKLVDTCMNTVYKQMKNVDARELTDSTPWMSYMVCDSRELMEQASTDACAEFAHRLRRYGHAAESHKRKMRDYHRLVREFQGADTSEQARPMLDFYLTEMRYHMMAFSKYMGFFAGLTQERDFSYEMEELDARVRVVDGVRACVNDLDAGIVDAGDKSAVRRMGRRYGVTNAALLASMDDHGHSYLEDVEAAYESELMRMQVETCCAGMSVEVEMDDEGHHTHKVEARLPYEFDDVKWCDLHDLSHDFLTDINVGERFADSYVLMTEERLVAFDAARHYLEATDQEDELAGVADVDEMGRMREFLLPFVTTHVIESDRGEGAALSQPKTFSLDYDLDKEIADDIDGILERGIGAIGDGETSSSTAVV